LHKNIHFGTKKINLQSHKNFFFSPSAAVIDLINNQGVHDLFSEILYDEVDLNNDFYDVYVDQNEDLLDKDNFVYDVNHEEKDFRVIQN